ncbi:MAG: single-stranded DNA-binding protein [Acidimicrobiia bacterium]
MRCSTARRSGSTTAICGSSNSLRTGAAGRSKNGRSAPRRVGVKGTQRSPARRRRPGEATLNSVILIGRLSAPTPPPTPARSTKAAPSASPSPNPSATRGFDGGPGTPSDRNDASPGADFVDIVCFDKLAATCAEWLTKGLEVAVVGKLHLSEWTSREGERRSRSVPRRRTAEFLPVG